MKKLLISLLLSSTATMLAMENNNNNVTMIDAKKALSMSERETLPSHNCDPASWCTWFWCGPCLAASSMDAEVARTRAKHYTYLVKLAQSKKEFNAIMAEQGFKEDPVEYNFDVVPGRYVRQNESQPKSNDDSHDSDDDNDDKNK